MNDKHDPMKKNPPEATENSASGVRETRRAERSTGSSVNGAPRPQAPNGQASAQGQSRPQAPNGKPSTQSPPLRSRREKQTETPSSPHRKGSVVLFRALIAVGAALALFLVVRLLLLFIPIRSIVVPEDSFYTAEELCEAMGIEEGARMYGFSVSKAEKTLKKAYPLLANVKFKRSFGGTLEILPEETACSFYVNVSGTFCALSREGFRVVLQSEDPERMISYGLYEISLPDVRVAFLGETLEYGDEKSNGYIDTLLDTLDSSALAGRITGIRAAERFRLSILIDGKYDIHLGNVNDLAKKLEYFVDLEALGKGEVFRSGSDAEIDLSDLSAVVVNPVEKVDTTVSES